MQTFTDFARTYKPRGTALYVASGPSGIHSGQYASTADACVMGEAGLHIPGRIPLMIFNNTVRAKASIPLFDRTDWILCPESLVNDTGHWQPVAEYDWLPKDKLVTWPRRKSRVTVRAKRMRKALHAKELAAFNFSVMGLLILTLLGYRSILCFGHDGGFGRAPRMLGDDDFSYDYTPQAQRVRKMAKVIEQASETRFFFYPDLPAVVA